MVRKNKVNLVLIISVIIFLISILFFLVALNLNSFLVLQKQEIPVRVRISNYASWNISENETVLNLGTLKKGTFANRSIQISNNYNFPTRIEVNAQGNITSLLIFDKVLYLRAKEDKDVFISTKIIEEEGFGDYFGTLTLNFKKD